MRPCSDRLALRAPAEGPPRPAQGVSKALGEGAELGWEGERGGARGREGGCLS